MEKYGNHEKKNPLENYENHSENNENRKKK